MLRAGLILFVPLTAVFAQQAPPSRTGLGLCRSGLVSPAAPAALAAGRPSLDRNRVYTLPGLVDIAEQNNPETRVLWERAKQRAAAAGVARSALFPTLAAVASASVNQYSLFFGKFYHEDTALFPAIVNLSYTVFDFGARKRESMRRGANLLAADFLSTTRIVKSSSA